MLKLAPCLHLVVFKLDVRYQCYLRCYIVINASSKDEDSSCFCLLHIIDPSVRWMRSGVLVSGREWRAFPRIHSLTVSVTHTKVDNMKEQTAEEQAARLIQRLRELDVSIKLRNRELGHIKVTIS